ncbi:MAG: family 16 glycosylhydrolase [Clostridium septicum]|uniref:family 16 glycosylhydrolase n=1 Tax=Clostridium septicum TaxID=1504 RepID=UPI00258711CD|nr:family 16 glycosylhydrolase [Clostridium septicum]MDU1314308.1 family 16 glycosylhydrolase [Clostridium septicum]
MKNYRKKISLLLFIGITSVYGLSNLNMINVKAATNHQYDLVELNKVNLIKNSSFELGDLNWNLNNGKISKNKGLKGSNAGVLDTTALTGSNVNGYVGQVVSVEKNTDYEITFWARVDVEGAKANFSIRSNNDSGKFLSDINGSIIDLAITTTEWKKYKVNLNSGENTAIFIQLVKWATPDDNHYDKTNLCSAYIDDVSVININSLNNSSNYEIIWADDFNTGKLDTNIWGYELGSIRGHEQQHYVNSKDNIFTRVNKEGGELVLKATNRPSKDQYYNPRNQNRKVIYNSGSIRTHGKKEFLYGRIEMRAKLPKGKGVFPAFWTLGSDFTLDGKIYNKQGRGWPECGEIDIMELTGQEENTSYGNRTVYQTLHYGIDKNDNGKYAGNGTNYSLSNEIFNDDYHIFGINWSKGKIEWYVDNKIVRTVDYSNDPIALSQIDTPQYIQLNLAMGGAWPGEVATNLAGSEFAIDYVYYAQNEQQKSDMEKYYSKQATITRVKDISMVAGSEPNLLDGISSNKNTSVDFSIENEPMFINDGGNKPCTSVDLLCRGKEDTDKLKALPKGRYNIHYTAIPTGESESGYVRKSAILTIK